MTSKRAEFSQKTKLEAMARYLRCPGVPEKQRKCGKPFGRLEDIRFDHVAAETFTHDNSPENCRPLCQECHDLKTFGSRATSAGSDVHMAAKGRRLRGETKRGPKAKIRSRPFPTPEQRQALRDRYTR
jgi:hypothetical protein